MTLHAGQPGDGPAELTRLRRENEALRLALKTPPILTDGQRQQLANGIGAILPAEEVFKIGWSAALRHVLQGIDREPNMRPLSTAEALRLILDQVDYTKGNCRPTELVGAALSTQVIEACRQALAKAPPVLTGTD